LVITEAMAAGVPVVASSLGAPQEIVEHGREGFVVDPRITQGLAEALAKLIDNPQLRRQMGQAGREKVSLVYSPERFARTLECLYQRTQVGN
jgi:glycosyltransferase involved in cell wall biosynthesis